MPFLLLFLVAWLAFLLLADRTRWREFVPLSLLAMIMSLTSDLIVHTYPLWTYHDTITHLPLMVVILLNDFGNYPFVTYLFLQYYPAQRGRMAGLRYFIYWTTGVILLESLFLWQGWMTHGMWWCLPHSYLADWLIFSLLLYGYRRFRRNPSGTLPTISPQTPAYIQYTHHNGFKLQLLVEREAIEIFLLEVLPGGHIPEHMPTREAMTLLVSGQLQVRIGDQQLSQQVGEVLRLPEDQVHTVWNDGQELAMCISIVQGAHLYQKLERCAKEAPTLTPMHV